LDDLERVVSLPGRSEEEPVIAALADLLAASKIESL
jgi:hypothetical protein